MLTGDMLRRSAQRFPQKPAILWHGTALSYADLDLAASRLANSLIDGGLKRGGKVGIISSNRTEYGVAFFGVARSGGVLVNVSVLYSPDELKFVLDKADVKVLIFEDIFAGKIMAVQNALPKIRALLCIGEHVNATTPFDEFAGRGADHYPRVQGCLRAIAIAWSRRIRSWSRRGSKSVMSWA
jgi:acyl-CoA synthetase (AMP-forming)/AMP-acid ligase II